MNKIIIDVDTGLDDTFAILLAANSPEIDIQGITTIAGNCSLENAINNTFKVLDLAKRNDIPVYKGMANALKENNKNATHVHGSNGLGGVIYEPIKREVESLHAVDYLIQTVNENPKEITIVTLGPLTNIAYAINKDKDFVKNVKSLIIMGGSTDKGNITPYAEFNFYKDPDAAKIVLEQDFEDITLIGLNITRCLPLNNNLENVLQNSNTLLSQFLYSITRTGASVDRKEGGLILNDPLTIAYLIDKDLIEFKKAIVTVETEGEKIGASNINLYSTSNCKVGYKVDTNKFYKLLFKRILNIDID